MKRQWAGVHYRTKRFESRAEGWAALELLRSTGETTERAARLTFWDATGQFAFEMFGGELPLGILEEFIAETKAAIPIS